MSRYLLRSSARGLLGNSTDDNVPQGIKDFCLDGQWIGSDFHGLSLDEYTPCFEDIVVLGAIHVYFITVGSLHLWAHYTSGTKKHEISNKKAIILRAALAFTTGAIPSAYRPLMSTYQHHDPAFP